LGKNSLRISFSVSWKCAHYAKSRWSRNFNYRYAIGNIIGESEGGLASSDKETGALAGLLEKNDIWPRQFYGDAIRRFAIRKVRTFQWYRKMLRFRCLREKFSWQMPEIPTSRQFGYCLQQSYVSLFSSRPRREIDDKGFKNAHTYKQGGKRYFIKITHYCYITIVLQKITRLLILKNNALLLVKNTVAFTRK